METKHADSKTEKRDNELCRDLNVSGISPAEALHRVPLPTFVIDKNHTVIHWNRAMENLTGIPASDMVGTNDHWRAFYPTIRLMMADFLVRNMHEEMIDTLFEGKHWKSLHDGSAYELEDYFPSVGGKERWLFCTATTIPDGTGKIMGAIETLLDVTERKKIENNLLEWETKYNEMSITDPVTKLYNSSQFFRQMMIEMERSERYNHPLSLLLFEIDDFKKYNDAYGQQDSDAALMVISDVIRKNMRSIDTGFRFMEEEFTVILPETDINEALAVAERLRKNIANAWLLPLSTLKNCVTASIGVTKYVPRELLWSVLDRVYRAMYSAKEKGKNQVCVEHTKKTLFQILQGCLRWFR